MYNQIFSEDFYPTPENVTFRMLGQIEVKGKTILKTDNATQINIFNRKYN